MNVKWNVNSLTNEQHEIVKKLDNEFRSNPTKPKTISPVLLQLLVQRGIKTYAEAESFFNPRLSDLHDPFLMKDMREAVERLNDAVRNKERILIYGDYDVDGTTAVALIYRFLYNFQTNIDYYLPDRYKEGYGISYAGIDYAAETGCTLIIALDCGIKAIEKVEYAKQKGIDFIICDHHMPGEQLPDAVAVLDPKREDCAYPYEHLSGCGVGFKLAQAFAEYNEIPQEELYKLLDLVAVSIASDIVPITEENRILAYYGLKKLTTSPILGLKTIIELTKLDGQEITVSDIVFKIGPRINASGRIQQAREAVELLVSNDVEFARKRCEMIDKYNSERKELDQTMTEEARTMLELDEKSKNEKAIVVYNENWHKGVIGIVASRLSEIYYRPTIVLTRSQDIKGEDIITGSARSVPGFDLYKAIDSCKDLLENFGGHTYAAGLALREENLEAFKTRFEQYVSENIEPEQEIQQIDIDAELTFGEITEGFFRTLKRFNPYGPENMKPVFCTHHVGDAGKSKLVGKNNEHLRVEISDKTEKEPLKGIAFKMSSKFEDLKRGDVSICYTLEENNYNGKLSKQIMVKDIQ